MKINQVEFIISAVSPKQYPKDKLPEIVVAGRSNVGKSSFINSVLNRNNIAYTSSKPGRTQTLNFFKINEQFYFVDVPGYGYAKVSKTDRQRFSEIIDEYLRLGDNIELAIQLVDFRHPPSKKDIQMYTYLTSYDIPCLVVATKVDKVSKNKREKQEALIKQALNMENPNLFVPYSAINHFNRNVILDVLDQIVGEEK
ncbi:MAG: ribosome biogenesis GTP-binding protein YihA/YsxC [Candidatus Izimaplasma sp.]|nr:ribosome biogenesis GTP-binding protein YihA/YsxC [Candidatus Izimaplasma bacterium]